MINVNPIRYLKTHGLRRAVEVIRLYKLPKLQVSVIAKLTSHRPLENKILIESHNDFDCNGGAFYDWLVENGYNEKIKIVWRLNYEPPTQLPTNVSCVPIHGPSLRRAWAICTSKWISSDAEVIGKVRDDQTAIYMTHGAFGLKECRGLMNIPATVDYLLSPSPHLDEYTEWEYMIDPDKTKLVHIGYPVLDRLYDGRHSNKYIAPVRNGLKTILWMPTFRQAVGGRIDSSEFFPYGIPLVQSREDLDDLSRVLKDAGVRLIIKLHPKQDTSHIQSDMPDGIMFLTGQTIKHSNGDNYDYMLDADALISDYSGATYEYLVLNRPVGFVLSDLSQYRLGMIKNAEKYMPGAKILNIDQLYGFIKEIGSGIDQFKEDRQHFIDWLYQPKCSGACQRVASLLMMDTVVQPGGVK